MAQNFIAPGEVIEVTLSATVAAGSAYKQGSIIGVALNSGVSGDTIRVQICGSFSGLPKATGTAWVQGDTLYWDATNSVFTKTSTSNTFAGYAYAAAASGDATGSVLLSH